MPAQSVFREFSSLRDDLHEVLHENIRYAKKTKYAQKLCVDSDSIYLYVSKSDIIPNYLVLRSSKCLACFDPAVFR